MLAVNSASICEGCLYLKLCKKKMFCSRKKSYYNRTLKQIIYANWRKRLVGVMIFPERN